MKKLLVLVCIALLAFGTAYGAEFAAGKGAMIVSGSVGFANYSGDSYKTYENGEEEDAALTDIWFQPALDYFVIDNLFVGGTLFFESESQDPWSESTFGIGPEVGYAFGKSESKMFPYGKLAFAYASSTYDSGEEGAEESTVTGTDIALAVGLIFPVVEHVGIMPELSYHMTSTKGDWDDAESMSDNVIKLSVGIAGLIW
ncbi:MAG: outer membrane beta-barrel protein [bacterium]|nr:outer membrane beta-barrel protein [bacterium]